MIRRYRFSDPEQSPDKGLHPNLRSSSGRTTRPFLAVLSLILLAAAGVLVWKQSSAADVDSGGSQSPAQTTPVQAAPVQAGSLTLLSNYPGELDADVSDLSSKIAGRLEEVRVRIGGQVKAGEVVAVVDDTDLQNQYQEAEAQVEISQADGLRVVAQLREARQELQRHEELFNEKLISLQQIESARVTVAGLEAQLQSVEAQQKRAEARVRLLLQQIEETQIRAPYTGVVGERYLDPGGFLQPGTPILRLIQGGPLRVRFWVPESELSFVRPGVVFQISTHSTAGKVFEGRVSRLSGEVNRGNRTVAVEGVVESTDLLLRPGMYAEVQVTRGVVTGTIVPGSAILSRLAATGVQTEGVFLATGDTARWRAVRVLGREGDWTAIRGDVSEGDLVLTFGHQDLADGSSIVISESSDLHLEEALP